MLERFDLQTAKEGLYDITQAVRDVIRESGVKEGICVAYCPHTTAGITINENADPDVLRDFLLGFDAAFPDRPEFRHSEGNSAAHLKTGVVGSSVTLIVRDGAPLLGVWQGVYFCEFDGPRRRQYYVKATRDA
ncbi:MAG: secondary thiamine-phosphate synthase enzyme YjbQ [Synergistaceae bacterium]|jgi:secondary thiamine-phosphate synthase enzyme|nr:secondary thiamine-phosphate synthase enzyme YjbQ [Synergistaceae bacterium]